MTAAGGKFNFSELHFPFPFAPTPHTILLKETNKKLARTDADFYRGARIYNSGAVASNNKLEFGVATHCYSSDIANRLTGWVWAEKTCPCDINPSSCGI